MSGDSLIILAVAVVLVGSIGIPTFLRHRRVERELAHAEERARRYGLHEPASLHPLVHPGACIGTGNCIAVCPEDDVLGLRDGQARLISAARCIGHGLCERACPVEAIQLVFGTEKRGVDIPRIKQNFETNVPGIYIIGELGGMGLVRNAFEQGRQCIEGIAKEPKRPGAALLDVLIVGCGPAGLSASLNCGHHKLRFKTLEKEDIGGTVRYYPRKKLVLTAPVKVPGYGKIGAHEMLKEDLMRLWSEIVATTGLRVNTHESVERVKRTPDGCFEVSSSKATYKTKRVVLAIGRRGVPRKLAVPGEELPKVIYSLLEPEAYQRDRVLVVGGGDSAIEAALALADQPGNHVTISYRKDAFSRIKPKNLQRIEEAVGRQRVEVLWSTTVKEIKPKSVVYANGRGGPFEIENDLTAIFVGGELPNKFLRDCGVAIDTKFGTP
ncbi:MAG: NAD(P)-binding domain-containing protein [Gemmatimonadota bacterium]|nr:NAD(P)-binding domain-containing protein [Gemmatimonadota bacterium]MDH4350115.1 NAD(P)-binding domain-containing protein [Gemmatimonadota bacterium]MDH5197310.1 NAD(P)-binding domain-containing protein [Gemmatimonadota bacterium]